MLDCSTCARQGGCVRCDKMPQPLSGLKSGCEVLPTVPKIASRQLSSTAEFATSRALDSESVLVENLRAELVAIAIRSGGTWVIIYEHTVTSRIRPDGSPAGRRGAARVSTIMATFA